MIITAICIFGVEAVLKRELINLGYKITETTDGRVSIRGDMQDVANCNVKLRTAERILIQIADFESFTFDQLFDETRKIEWQDFISEEGTFPVNVSSVDSKLFSTRDCQSVAKKAISEKLGSVYGINRMPEVGEEYPIDIFIHRNRARVYLDTTGVPLHKRGYRKLNVEAPLRETIASALIQISYWRPGRVLLDPFCGSGTFPIEAAMIQMNIAPGLKRDFLFEKWSEENKEIIKQVKEDAFHDINKCEEINIFGSDISPENIKIAKTHSHNAGTSNCIQFDTKDFRDISITKDFGILICNPPYGVRIKEKHGTDEMYKHLVDLMENLPTWSKYVLVDEWDFERKSNIKASRKRKIYNGSIVCTFYQYYGPRPSE